MLTNTATANYQSMGKPGRIQATSDFTITAAPVIFTNVQIPTSGPVGTLVLFTLTLSATSALQQATIVDDLSSVGYSFVPGSVIVYGTPEPTDDPSTGINLGAIPQNGSKTVTFQGGVQ